MRTQLKEVRVQAGGKCKIIAMQEHSKLSQPVPCELNNAALPQRAAQTHMPIKNDEDLAELKALGVSDELVESLSPVEVSDLLLGLLHLREKYHVAIHSA
jgi:hypothetical protein